MASRTSIRRIRGPHLSDTDLTDDQLRTIVTAYIPVTIRRVMARFGIREWRPWQHTGTGGIAAGPRGGLVLKGGHHNAGGPTVPCYISDDEFLPMLEWAAHHIARRVMSLHRSGAARLALAGRFALTPGTTVAAVSEPRIAVPFILRELRGITVNERALAKYRSLWRRSFRSRRSRQVEHHTLDSMAHAFLEERQQPRAGRSHLRRVK